MQCARQRDVIDIVSRARGERTLLSPAGHASVNELRTAREQHIGAEPQSFHHAGTKSFDDRVRFVGEQKRRGNAVFALEIERDRPPPAKHDVVPSLATETQTRV